MFTSTEIRQIFLDYFRDRGHTVVPSSSLVPGNDPTLLFTNAGMVQFKDVFTSTESRSYTRATSAQKCMRVSGKHNDLENVGPSPRHHTFFEMLGNFSFGDYFKREAITYAWEFLTQVMGLDWERLFPTIYLDDDEAFVLWQEVAGIPGSRITRFGKKDNFWAMGDTGPNGPCSEILYDRGPEHCTCGLPDCSPACECERWWELWNLVFMQFETTSDGTTRPLPKPSIDTGMGMERLTAIMQSKNDNYETDLFWPLIQRTQQMLGHSDEQLKENLVSYRVIADHCRAIAFLIADGILPGNEGRNYVLRLILRRAARHGRMLGFQTPFMAEVLKVAVDIMGEHYRELSLRREFILEAATQEEERFLQTLDIGLNLLDHVIAEVQQAERTTVPGEQAFRLYDTYGFPLDLTRDVAREHGLSVDEQGFQKAMEAQRERARAAQQFGLEREQELYRSLNLPATAFLGYETSASSSSTVLALIQDGHVQEQVGAGQDVQVVLDRTPFYAESGGQVGDTGVIEGPRGKVEIRDTYQPSPGLAVHVGRVSDGSVARGEQVKARLDEARHLDIARNHTATHLLHRALQQVLGEHALQAGSLVAPDRLRFDFTHLQPVSADELRQIQRRVSLGGDYSRELCGGTHLDHTGQIGFFKIVSESSIGSGLRRIEAITGRGAEAYVERQADRLAEAAAAVQAQPADLTQRIHELAGQLREQQHEIDRLRSQSTRETVEQLLSQVGEVKGVQVIAARVDADSVERMREMTDRLREGLGSAVIVLAAVVAEKPILVAAVSPDLVDRGLHAGKLVGQLAKTIGGGGGGRATMAQAGGQDSSNLKKVLNQVQPRVRDMLSGA
jgi:alanyl-tRNA synthetase